VWPARCDYCEVDLVFDAVEYPFPGKTGREKPLPEGYPWQQFGRVKSSKSEARKSKLEKLREQVGSDDVNGYQEQRASRPERPNRTPDWMLSDQKIQQLCRHISFSMYSVFGPGRYGFWRWIFGGPQAQFPSNEIMRLRCLYWYYRCSMTTTQVAAMASADQGAAIDWKEVKNIIYPLSKIGNRLFGQSEAGIKHWWSDAKGNLLGRRKGESKALHKVDVFS
jgi:hypothetical protein